MNYTLRPAAPTDAPAIVAIFNRFVTDSYAAYPSDPVDESFYERLASAAGELPFVVAVDESGDVVGFAQLRWISPADSLRHAAEVSYFLAPQHTGKGLGSRMLDHLEREGSAKHDITILLASVSSENSQSLDFHRKHGFAECGRFARVGTKFGREFDIVWLQKFL